MDRTVPVMPEMPVIRGVDVDPQGRCRHWHGPSDVVANRCSACDGYWACHLCHDELSDHPFAPVPRSAPDSVLCGACGHLMGWSEYSGRIRCPACSHPFNPGCQSHSGIYFASE